MASATTGAVSAESLRPPEWCPNGDDGQHCGHWWDDTGPCCRCGDDTDAGLSDAAPGRKAGERV